MIFLLSLLFNIYCSLQPPVCKKGECITVISATRQSWTAGTKNGGSGTNYEIKCVAGAESEKLKVLNLYVAEQLLEAKAYKDLSLNPSTKFNAGDTIFVIASRFISGPPGTEAQKKVPPPAKFKGEALLVYKCSKKNRYQAIDSFKILEKLNMP